MIPYRIKWKRRHDAVYWLSLKIVQSKGLAFWQTISNVIILNDSMPADCLMTMANRDHENLRPMNTQESPVTPKVVLRARWQTHPISTEKPLATPMTLEPRIDNQYQGMLQAEIDEGSRKNRSESLSKQFLTTRTRKNWLKN